MPFSQRRRYTQGVYALLPTMVYTHSLPTMVGSLPPTPCTRPTVLHGMYGNVLPGFNTFNPEVEERKGSREERRPPSLQNKPLFSQETGLIRQRNPPQRGCLHKECQNLLTLQKEPPAPPKVLDRLYTPVRISCSWPPESGFLTKSG